MVFAKIKTWERMVEEFGLLGKDHINCEDGFTKSMENRMPENRIIVVNDDMWYPFEGEMITPYFISNDMVDHWLVSYDEIMEQSDKILERIQRLIKGDKDDSTQV